MKETAEKYRYLRDSEDHRRVSLNSILQDSARLSRNGNRELTRNQTHVIRTPVEFRRLTFTYKHDKTVRRCNTIGHNETAFANAAKARTATTKSATRIVN